MGYEKRSCNICAKLISDDKCIPLAGDSCVCSRCGAMISRAMGAYEFNFNEETGKASFSDDTSFGNAKTPSKIKNHLDQYVIGQDHAKEVLSVAAYNHYKRINRTSTANKEVTIEKSNVLLLGPTGCGKTYLVSTIAKVLGVPFAHCDATSFTEAGFIGEDVESCLTRLLMAANMNVEEAERGIVFIDEIDKLTSNGNGNDSPAHVGVQQALLKLIEGADGIAVPTSVDTNKDNRGSTKTVTMSSKNILFICGGAFSGIEEIIKKRMNGACSIGIGANVDKADAKENIMNDVMTEDIVKYGLKSEFVGRLPVLTTLEEMTEEMLVSILMEPKNCLFAQYRELLREDEVDFEITHEAALAISKKALAYKTGARSLRSVMEKLLIPIMFSIPDRDDLSKVILTPEYVNGDVAEPLYEMRTFQQRYHA